MSWGLLFRMASRDLVAHRRRTLLTGFLLTAVTALVAGGVAVADALDRGLSRSATETLTGQLQLASADAPDALALYGDAFLGLPDVGALPDFARVEAVVKAVPGVTAVVPMSEAVALLRGYSPWTGPLDRLFDRLGGDFTQDPAFAQDLRIIQGAMAGFLAPSPVRPGELSPSAPPEALKRALRLSAQHLDAQEPSTSLLVLGTDVPAFRQAFPRLTAVRGTLEGARGLWLPESVYRTALLHPLTRAARAYWDAPSPEARFQRRTQLALAAYLAVQELPPKAAAELGALLPGEPLPEAELAALWAQFPGVTDEAFRRQEAGPLEKRLRHFLLDEQRQAAHRAFFEQRLERFFPARAHIGGPVSLRGFNQGDSGQVEVVLRGTFEFKGLEDAPLAGLYALTDPETFRALSGTPSAADRAEMAEIKAKAGLNTLSSRAEAEAALFGDAPPAPAPQQAPAPLARPSGVAHAAVCLADASPAGIAQGQAAVQAALDQAGLRVNAVDWRTASGVVGQVLLVVQLVLFGLVAAVMLAAFFVIHNALVQGTLDRIPELGTLRALGASPGFLRRLLLLEGLLLGAAASLVGVALAAILLAAINGLPAQDELTRFLFSGPTLTARLTAGQAIGTVFLVSAFSALAALYPAKLAAGLSPAQAMGEGT